MNTKTIKPLAGALLSAILFGFIAGFQKIGISRDYENYLSYFEWINGKTLIEAISYRFEPGFAIITLLLSLLNTEGPLIYFFISGICIFIKFYAIKDTRNYQLVFITLLVFYLLRYFTLFEMTVLRATLAMSLAFYVFFRRDTQKINIIDILLLMTAASMHFSAVAFIPIYLYTPTNKKNAAIITILVFFLFLGLSEFAIKNLPNYISVFETYDEFNPSTFIPKPMILDILYIGFLIRYWRKLNFQSKTAIYGTLISFSIHFSLLQYSIIGGRLKELLSVFFLIIVTQVIGYSKNKSVRFATVIFILTSGITHVYTTYIHDPLLT